MATNITTTAQGSSRPGITGYEPRDASVPWIFAIVLFLICCGILIQVVLSATLKHLVKTPAPTDAWRTTKHESQRVQAAPFPRLQVSPRFDLAQFRAQEDQELTNYGWVNRTAGIVRVPISRAIDLVLQKGLPVRTNLASGVSESPLQLIEKRALERKGGP
jgi:hypothetical protein